MEVNKDIEAPAPPFLRSVGRLLGWASAMTNTLAERRLKPHGLTLKQWITLSALWRSGPMRESDLAAYCHMTTSALSRLLTRMADKDFVVRETGTEDRRTVRISLGETGEGLSHLIDAYATLNALLMEGFSDEEQDMLVSLLERVIANVERALNP